MIETKNEWKRAFKGILIFIGSAFVLLSVIAILRPSSENSQSNPSVHEEKKKKEPVYSLEKQYSDYLSFNLIPLMNENDKIMKEYKLYVNPSVSGDSQEQLSKYGHQLESSKPFLEELVKRQQKVQEKLASLSLPQDFSSKDSKLFENSIKKYSDSIGYQIQYIQATIDFTSNYTESGLSFLDYISKETQPLRSLEYNTTHLLQKTDELTNDFVTSLEQLNRIYNVKISNLFNSTNNSTPL